MFLVASRFTPDDRARPTMACGFAVGDSRVRHAARQAKRVLGRALPETRSQLLLQLPGDVCRQLGS
jgi:hypothetical protein